MPLDSRNLALDHIRFLAAAMVVVWHCSPVAGQNYVPVPWLSLFEEGHFGVSIFMVLSGFIFGSLAFGKSISFLNFIAARWLRLAPVLIFWLMAAHAAKIFSLAAVAQNATLLFLSNDIASAPQRNWLGPTWSIAIEFQFYLLVPLLALLPPRRLIGATVAAILLLLVARCLVMAAGADIQHAAYYSALGRLDQLLIGFAAGVAWARLSELGHPLASMLCRRQVAPLAAIAGLVIAMTYVHIFNLLGGYAHIGGGRPAIWILIPLADALASLVLILGYLCLGGAFAEWFARNPISRVLGYLGAISYSIYLCHVLVIRALSDLYLRHGVYFTTFESLIAFAPLALVASIAVASLTYHLIEQPFSRLKPAYRR